MVYNNIRFVYDEPAVIVKADETEYLVVSDLHIGMELGLSRKGVHIFGATNKMTERIRKIMKEFSLKDLIILGDVKESILYPETSEVRLLKDFFGKLDDFRINIIAGNHDAHLSEIIGHEVKKELIIGNFGFIHGNSRPDEKIMGLDYIISGHDHLAVRIREKSGALYEHKAWAIYKLNITKAKTEYQNFNKDIKLISMPAFNDLIMGTTIEKGSKKRLNPLLSNGIFGYRGVEIYNLTGQRVELD